MSALTSLLVRDQVVPVRKIEEALQRQVVSGGDVETVLLEMDAVAEDVLAAYRAAVVGRDPATRESVMRAARDVVRLVPREVAERHRLVPIALIGRTLVVGAAAPLSAEVDSQLAFLLGFDLTVRIASEVRIAAALAMHYGVEAPPRLARLAERLATRDPGVVPVVTPPELTGEHNLPAKRRAGIFDDDDDDSWEAGDADAAAHGAAAAVQEERSTRPFGFQTVPERTTMPGPAARMSQRSAAPAAVAPSTPAPAAPSAPIDDTDAREAAPPPPPATSSPGTSTGAGRSRAPRPSMKLRGPLVLEQAMEMLQAANTRDEVLGVFFTFARQFFDYSVLFVVGDDQAEGREAYGSGTPTVDVQKIAVPLGHGLLADVRKDGVLRIGTLDKGADDRELAQKLGRATTTPVAIVPLFIRSRVVLLLYGDRGGEAFGLHDLPELLGVLPRVGEAFERLIMARKGSYTPADRAARADLKASAVPPAAKDTKRPPSAGFAKGSGSGEGGIAKRLSKAPPAPEPAPPLPSIAPEPAPPTPSEPTRAAPTTPPAKLAAAAPPTRTSAPIDALSLPPPSTPSLSPGPEPTTRDTLVDMVPPVEGIAATLAQASVAGVVPARTRRGEGGPLAVLGVPRSAPPPPMPRRPISQTIKAISAPLPPPVVSETAKTTSFVKPEVPSTPAPAPVAPAGAPVAAAPKTPAAAPVAAASKPAAASKLAAASGLVSKSAPTLVNSAPAPLPPADASDEPQTIVESTSIDEHDDEPEMTVSSSASEDVDDLSDLEPEPEARPTRPLRGIGNYAMHIGSEEHVGKTEVTAVKREKDTHPDSPRALTARPPGRSHAEEPKVIVDMGESVEAVVVDLLRSPPEDPSAIDRLLRLGEPALPVLVQGFPGHLWFDRHAPHTRLPRGRDVSAAARALVAFGDRAVPYVVTLLGSRDADTRFYATLVAAELPNAGLVPGLGQRVFDDDPNTRALVLDVLKLFARYAGMRDVLDRIRIVARSPDKDVATRRMAVRALGELRDPRAVSLLVKLLEGTDPAISRESLRSLVLLTRQDLGDSPRKWEAWMAKNESRHRIEWLIDALLSDEDPLRAAAGDELQRLTHEYYGFHAGSPRKDRERVHKKYRDWWEREGKGKFSA